MLRNHCASQRGPGRQPSLHATNCPRDVTTGDVATIGLFYYCVNCQDWERYPTKAIHISSGIYLRAQSAFPIELLALFRDLAFQKHANTSRRIISDCQAAITPRSPNMLDESNHIQSSTLCNITLACHRHLSSRKYIEKVKAHVERGKNTRNTWTFEEIGNFIADIDSGRSRVSRETSPRGSPAYDPANTVELLLQLISSDIWNIYGPDMNPLSWAHAATM